MDEAIHTDVPRGGGKPAKAARANNDSLKGAADKTGRHVSGPPPRAAGAHANSSHKSGHPGALRATSLGEEEEAAGGGGRRTGEEEGDCTLESSALGLHSRGGTCRLRTTDRHHDSEGKGRSGGRRRRTKKEG